MAAIHGVSGSSAERIQRWCKESAALLGISPDFSVTVEGPIFALSPPPHGTPIGSGNADGVWLHRWTATWAQDAYLGFIMYEEVAHHALARESVPHEGLGDFMHEVFATWFQCQHWITTRRAHKAGLTNFISNPVLPGGPPQNVGKHLGGALAGIAVNRQHLDRWLQRLGGDDPRRHAVVETERLLPRPMTATDAAEVYRELLAHAQAGQAWR